MLRKPLLLLMLALLLAGAFVAGVAQLFALRYEKGDVYPPYSSLRADPLGAKGLYDALGQLPGLDAQRNYKPLPKLKPAGPITLMYAGVPRYAAWDEEELLDLNTLMHSGSRAIITFNPIERSPGEQEQRRLDADARRKKKEKTEKAKGEKLGGKNRKTADAKDDDKKEPGTKGKNARKKAKDGESDEDSDEGAKTTVNFDEAVKRWGFAFDFLPADEQKAFHRIAVASDRSGGLEPEISWHTALYFKDLKPEWKVLYTCENHPVIIERKLGKGSLVFSADSFLISNEALRTDRLPHLLARFFDGPPQVIFDEEHHDVREEPGMATLARKYHLQSVVAGLILLTALFVWKNAVRFLPARKSGADESGVVAGKESSEGYVNLLRRAIKPAEILGICVGEWRKAFPNRPREMARIDEIFGQEQARPSRERNTVAAYQTICQSLTRQR